MADKTILHATFWYIDDEGRHLTALRGDTVAITRDEDLKRGERYGAFATAKDLAAGTPLRRLLDLRQANAQTATPAPAEVEATPDAKEERPAPSATKPDWVAYHVSQRPDDVDEDTARAEAEAMTKAELVARYVEKPV
ncbi:hypothetical protein TPA0907_55770 [Micromonospora humidisoli]|uniref:hypothetical protein n=1 Tax=Micromonospora sp. AKA109 TaxID=2733865 RepID=UPI0022C1320C|nr:hypothetical protein [Micromonospora sp. AKA109]GHJ11210.1 hypothetical protein TPA0907_55770 [Micromonospora sp. AKA109]